MPWIKLDPAERKYDLKVGRLVRYMGDDTVYLVGDVNDLGGTSDEFTVGTHVEAYCDDLLPFIEQIAKGAADVPHSSAPAELAAKIARRQAEAERQRAEDAAVSAEIAKDPVGFYMDVLRGKGEPHD